MLLLTHAHCHWPPPPIQKTRRTQMHTSFYHLSSQTTALTGLSSPLSEVLSVSYHQPICPIVITGGTNQALGISHALTANGHGTGVCILYLTLSLGSITQAHIAIYTLATAVTKCNILAIGTLALQNESRQPTLICNFQTKSKLRRLHLSASVRLCLKNVSAFLPNC